MEINKYKCPDCDFEGKTKSALTSHTRSKHGEPAKEEFLPHGLGGGLVEATAVIPEAEAVAGFRPEPMKVAGAMYVVTDLASFGPVKINGQTSRLVRGVLYPFNAAEYGRLLTKGVVRMATDKDIAKIRRLEAGGSGGAVTSASMAGVGIKRQ